MKSLSKIAAACLLAVMSKVVVALPILQPTDLNPGDTYQLVFQTSSWAIPDSTDIADYNAFVQSKADYAWLGGGTILDGVQWSAIGSTATVDARDNALVSGPVYNLGDQLLATGFADMWDGSLANPVSYNENGTTTLPSRVWTGTDPYGYAASGSELGACCDSGGDNWDVSFGSSRNTSSEWITDTNAYPSGGFRYPFFGLYALSEVITVPNIGGQVPVPATLSLFGLGLAGLGISRRKRQTKS